MACLEMDFSTVLVTQASCDVFIIKGIWQSNITYATKFRISLQREKARTKMYRQIKEERSWVSKIKTDFSRIYLKEILERSSVWLSRNDQDIFTWKNLRDGYRRGLKYQF